MVQARDGVPWFVHGCPAVMATIACSAATLTRRCSDGTADGGGPGTADSRRPDGSAYETMLARARQIPEVHVGGSSDPCSWEGLAAFAQDDDAAFAGDVALHEVLGGVSVHMSMALS